MPRILYPKSGDGIKSSSLLSPRGSGSTSSIKGIGKRGGARRRFAHQSNDSNNNKNDLSALDFEEGDDEFNTKQCKVLSSSTDDKKRPFDDGEGLGKENDTTAATNASSGGNNGKCEQFAVRKTKKKKQTPAKRKQRGTTITTATYPRTPSTVTTPSPRQVDTTKTPSTSSISWEDCNSFTPSPHGLDCSRPKPPPQEKPRTLQSHVRHALLVDTRTLDTKEGNEVGYSFLGRIRAFLHEMKYQRGSEPCLLGTVVATSSSTNSKSKNTSPKASHNNKNNLGSFKRQQTSKSPSVRMASRTTMEPKITRMTEEHGQLNQWHQGEDTNPLSALLEPMLIRPPINAKNSKNKQVIKVPMRLLANSSWKIFGDLLHALVQHDEQHQDKIKQKSLGTASHHLPPLSVTLVTNDVAFLCDTGELSHKQAQTKFWNSIRPLFHNNKVRSIDLLVVETGVVTTNHSNNKDGLQNQENPTPENEDDFRDLGHHGKVMNIIKVIKGHFNTRADADYKVDRNREVPVTPVTVRFSVMDNTPLAFDSLARKWVLEIMNPPLLRRSSKSYDCISFELPESFDTDDDIIGGGGNGVLQCTVSLDLKYKVLPFKANSIAAAGLVADLELLSKSKMEVLQLVPLSCIDASLLFGVPIAARAGFCEKGTIDQYTEMKTLVHFLFGYLVEKQVAMLLRSCDDADNAVETRRNGLYHSNRQTFLLMAEEGPDQSSTSAASQSQTTLSQTSSEKGKYISSEAMLFRYVASHQMLDVGSADLHRNTPETGMEDETTQQLGRYIENAMDCLETNSINPLINQEFYPVVEDKLVGDFSVETMQLTTKRDRHIMGTEDGTMDEPTKPAAKSNQNEHTNTNVKSLRESSNISKEKRNNNKITKDGKERAKKRRRRAAQSSTERDKRENNHRVAGSAHKTFNATRQLSPPKTTGTKIVSQKSNDAKSPKFVPENPQNVFPVAKTTQSGPSQLVRGTSTPGPDKTITYSSTSSDDDSFLLEKKKKDRPNHPTKKHDLVDTDSDSEGAFSY